MPSTNDEPRILTIAAQDAPGPQTHEEARQFHEGFLSGATAYASAVGHSTLKSENPKLCEVFDAQGWKTVTMFENLPPENTTATDEIARLTRELTTVREELRKRMAWRLTKELERTADKLSGIWIHLDAYARGEPFTRRMARSILVHTQAPGWRDLTPEEAERAYAQAPAATLSNDRIDEIVKEATRPQGKTPLRGRPVDDDGRVEFAKPASTVATPLSREIAARVWCDREMRTIAMDIEAAEKIAQIIDEVRHGQADAQSYTDLAASGGIVGAP